MANLGMTIPSSIQSMRLELADRFPKEAERADSFLVTRGFEADAHSIWLEEFSNATTAAMRAQDERTVREYLSFMSKQLARADDELKKYIDVSYVEPLMHGLDVTSKKWAWKFIPASLKTLYVSMWGEPRF